MVQMSFKIKAHEEEKGFVGKQRRVDPVYFGWMCEGYISVVDGKAEGK